VPARGGIGVEHIIEPPQRTRGQFVEHRLLVPPTAAPWMASEPARHWIVVTLACVFAFAAFANAWATRGRHFGWMALSAVVGLAIAGY